jgi:hypothetical protein
MHIGKGWVKPRQARLPFTVIFLASCAHEEALQAQPATISPYPFSSNCPDVCATVLPTGTNCPGLAINTCMLGGNTSLLNPRNAISPYLGLSAQRTIIEGAVLLTVTGTDDLLKYHQSL